jgi:hypothetical protein
MDAKAASNGGLSALRLVAPGGHRQNPMDISRPAIKLETVLHEPSAAK